MPYLEGIRARNLSGLMSDGMDLLPVFEEMQANGMPASRVRFQKLHDDMQEAMNRIGKEISDKYYGGRPFNPNSPDKVAALLRRRGKEATKITKTGKPSTDKKSIEHLRYEDDAFKLVFDWREHAHIKDSYCVPFLEILPEDRDISIAHCSINTTRTHTRRLSTKQPNLLAIPIRTDIGRRVRECFVCEEGEVFGAWDLSQIEARRMAHESRDRALCKFFIDDRDIHRETAALIFGIDARDVDEMKHRLPAKNTLFGVLYGIAGEGLKTQLWKLGQTHWTVDSCQDLIDEFLKLYKGVAEYIKLVGREVKSSRWNEVRDHWQMSRYLPAIAFPDRKLAAEAARQAVSHRIQGGAQGMIQNSMRYLRYTISDIQKKGVRVKWRLQIHDEIILTFPPKLWSTLDQIVTDAMVNHCGDKLIVPVKAKGHTAQDWGGLK